MTNLEIARLLRKIAAAYTILGENRFKIIAYDNAATAVEHATSELKDLWDDGKLETVPGLGTAISSHLDELFRLGQSHHFEKVLDKVNPAVFPLLDIPGLGPKKAQKLTEELGMKDPKTVIETLEKAARAHKIASLASFGAKSETDILDNIARFRQGAVKERRMLLSEADILTEGIIEYIREIGGIGDIRVDKLGSLRRRAATIGDIDIAVATEEPEIIIEAFANYPKKARQIERGPTGASILLAGGHQADLRVGKPAEYGAMLQYFTGSKYHNIRLREYALKKGYSLSEYGIKIDQRLKIPSKLKIFSNEKDFYNFLGLEYIPPELREDNGEIEAALRQVRQAHCKQAQGLRPGLPNLVSLDDIKGDLQMHTSFSPETSHDSGTDTIGEMREMGEIRGYEYIGVSDHNPSVAKHNPKEIVEELQKRKKAIEQINYSTKGTRVINLLEVDIMPNGELPVSDEGMALLDAALVGVHSVFRMDRTNMTNRVIKGLSHPWVKILAHPTGRILNRREGYELDWDKIFAFCLEYDKALEINATPDRLDLPDTLVREAVKKGVKLSLGTDAHDKESLKFMPYGVAVARRGWAEAKNIINTWSYDKISRWLKAA